MRSIRSQTFRWVSAVMLALPLLTVFSATVAPRTAAAAVPADFEDRLVANVSGGPTELAWTPDGRMLIGTKTGRVRVYQNGQLLSTPALDLGPVMCTNGERALGGIAVHPNFASNGYIYVYYTFKKYGTCNESEVDGPVNRLSRFTLPSTNIIDKASEVVLMDTPPLFRDHHNAGDLWFAKDGYLYVTVGDGGTARFNWPQDPGRLLGKVVRLTDTGGIPTDNPFTGSGTARCNVDGVPPSGSAAGTKCQEIFALGLRNPWRFAFDPDASGVRFYIGDVGQHSWEEINEGQSGANYGWPEREGPCVKDSTTDCGPPPPGMTNPIYWYGHGTDGAAVTGVAFVPDGVWPSSYNNSVIYADYVFGEIYQLTPDGAGWFTQTLFAQVPRVVSLRFGPYGTGQGLYYTSREDGTVRVIVYTGSVNRAPTARATANPSSGPLPLAVQFDGSTSSDPDGDTLSYEWDFQTDGTVDATGPTTSHTYTTAGSYTATLRVHDGRGGENSVSLRIDAGNNAPVATIETPTDGTLFAVGEQFTLRGSATDAEDGPLPDSALTWEVIKHHATHTHPFLDPTTGNNLLITGPEPEDLDAAKDSYLEIRLTATDSSGITHTVVRELHPKKVDVTFQSEPPGLSLTVSGFTITTPATVVSWDAYDMTANAPNQTDAQGQSWVFDRWSDGGAQTHTITTPAAPASYTAYFEQGGESPPSTVTLNPTADAYVREDKPTRNAGTETALAVDGSPKKVSYLQFAVPSGGQVTSARLRLFVTDSSSDGGTVVTTSAAWTETGLTWANRPALDGMNLGPLGAATNGAWIELDVTAAVSAGTVFSIGISSANSNGADYASREGTNRPELIVTSGSAGGGDTEPPSAPGNLTATAVSPNQIDLQWQASTDNTGVAGYTIYRGGAAIATVDGSTLSYQDSSLAENTAYEYTVDAFDAAENHSGLSNVASATTPSSSSPVTLSFTPVADAQVRSEEPDRNFGKSSSIRTDASPVINSYLKFDVSGLSGSVKKATLRIYATSSNAVGYDVRGVTDTSWQEGTITYNNAPAFLSAITGSSGRVTGGTWIEVDVTALVQGNGILSFAMTSPSSTATNFASRESGANAPQLIIETSP